MASISNFYKKGSHKDDTMLTKYQKSMAYMKKF
jgi:hypothetical protein